MKVELDTGSVSKSNDHNANKDSSMMVNVNNIITHNIPHQSLSKYDGNRNQTIHPILNINNSTPATPAKLNNISNLNNLNYNLTSNWNNSNQFPTAAPSLIPLVKLSSQPAL